MEWADGIQRKGQSIISVQVCLLETSVSGVFWGLRYLAEGRGREVGSSVRLIVPLIAECEGARDWDDFVVRITPKTGNQVAIKW